MKTLVLALASVALALTGAQAATRIEALTALPATSGQTTCTGDRMWCVTATDDTLIVAKAENRNYRDVAKIPMVVPREDEFTELKPWASVVRVTLPKQKEFALVGIERTERQMYSGGSASVTKLQLYEVREGTATPLVLEAPLASGIMVRACFTEADAKRRLDACHDEYRFSAALTANVAQRSDAPRLLYRSHAETFPGRRKRTEDSLEAPPLKKSDLRPVTDKACSVERTLTRNKQTGAFEWSAPLPACTDYLEP